MPRTRIISGIELIKELQKLGCIYKRQTGSHAILEFCHDLNLFTIVVPLHKEVSTGVLRSLYKRLSQYFDEEVIYGICFK